MSYFKVIQCGHITQVWEMEHAPHIEKKFERCESQNDLLDPRDFQYWSGSEQTKEAWTKHKNNMLRLENERKKELFKVDRKEERKRQTLRDAKNKVLRLAIENFSKKSYFITLTYKDNMQDVKKADQDFKNFFKRFKYQMSDENAKYIAVREFQKRGAIHYHIITDIRLPLPDLPEGWGVEMKNGKRKMNTVAKNYDEKYLKPLEREIGTKVWKHGYVDIKIIEHVDNVGAYMVKYMSKHIEDRRLDGFKVYLNSKGLIQPKTYKGEDALNFLEETGLLQKKEAFTNSYISEYQGQIVFREFNPKRSNPNN